MAPPGASLTLEVEVSRRALFEPQAIVVGRILEELGRLLQHVPLLPLWLSLLTRVLGLHVVLHGLDARIVHGLAASGALRFGQVIEFWLVFRGHDTVRSQMARLRMAGDGCLGT